ncbi:MAG TPA: hypothetical protein VKW78_14300 [Terriglobales bacterium]|nr:hypothetical protein [Terriglobales bacterium]
MDVANDEWLKLRDPEISRASFGLYRLVPTSSWTVAEFVFEDEQSNRLGSYVSRTRVRADVELHGRRYEMYIQRSGAFASKWGGKVGASSESAIVIRTREAIVSELFPVRKFPSWSYSFTSEGKRYEVSGGGWLPTKPHRVSRGTELVGIYQRESLGSQKVLLALRRDLPDTALLPIVVAALVQ